MKLWDLLITDLTMPGMGTRDLALELRRHQADLRVLFMSVTEEAVDLAIMAEGVRDCWLSKPFNPEDLVNIVCETLEGIRRRLLPIGSSIPSRSLPQPPRPKQVAPPCGGLENRHLKTHENLKVPDGPDLQ